MYSAHYVAANGIHITTGRPPLPGGHPLNSLALEPYNQSQVPACDVIPTLTLRALVAPEDPESEAERAMDSTLLARYRTTPRCT